MKMGHVDKGGLAVVSGCCCGGEGGVFSGGWR